MLNFYAFDDEIVLWWDKDRSKKEYAVFVSGKLIAKTDRTFYRISSLSQDTEYFVKVEDIGEKKIRTPRRKKRLDITQAPYFAVGDGKTVNTRAIQQALTDCKADECVYVPNGTFLVGALDVYSDSELYVSKGAVLKGSEDPSDYLPKIRSRFEGIEGECYRSLINAGTLDKNGAYNCKNVVIRGGGVISGGGKTLCEEIIERERLRLKNFMAANPDLVNSCECERTLPGRARGRLIAIHNCQNAVICDLTLQYAPSWNVHFVYSENVLTFGCKIESQGVWNGDGWDPDSSENCTVFDTVFHTHDDAIAIKSGKNPEGNVIAKPAKNIRIFSCKGRNGIAIGSEMSGGVDGVYIWDCDFSSSYVGIRLKFTKKRGGYIRNVHVYDSALVNINASAVTYNDDGEAAPNMPKIEDCSFENVKLSAFSSNLTNNVNQEVIPIVVYGVPEQTLIRNFRFSSVSVLRKVVKEKEVCYASDIFFDGEKYGE